MSSSGRDVAAERAAAVPLPEARVPRLRVDDGVVVDVLSRLTAAATRSDAAAAALPVLLALDGVRAGAVVVREGRTAMIVGSAGYGCGPMDVGADLPLDAGLPVTEAVRTGRPVVQGTGPSWVAVPFGGRAGALLLSCTAAPPQGPDELVRLSRISRAIGDALHRTAVQERAVTDLAVVQARLAMPTPAAHDVVVRSLPFEGAVGGDVALVLPDGRGGRWLVVADVCGAGVPAAVIGASVSATFTALAPYVSGPAALLTEADRALRAVVQPGLFVTAVVVHERDGRLTVSSAGHPPVLLVDAGGVTSLDVEPGLPLAIDSHDPRPRAESAGGAPDAAVLVLHSDGLVDRRTPAGACAADPAALVAGRPLDDLHALADAVLAAAAEVGDPCDDATLLLARPLR